VNAGPRAAGAPVLAFVGAGGKTGAIFALSAQAAAAGLSVLVTTTTKMADPRGEKNQHFDEFSLSASSLDPGGRPIPAFADRPASGERGRVLVLGSGIEEGSGKMLGLSPDQVGALAPRFDLVLVEADGSRGRPVKAPAAHEPVIPASSSMVLALIGLDCLGRTADEANVHRLADFLSVVGLKEGEKIGAAQLARLASSPVGLFKGAPGGAFRVAVLSKADLVPAAERVALVEGLARTASCDLVLALARGLVLCSLETGRPR
jgi:probable selenium-dependent hydroxylase accessory protein YqeC